MVDYSENESDSNRLRNFVCGQKNPLQNENIRLHIYSTSGILQFLAERLLA